MVPNHRENSGSILNTTVASICLIFSLIIQYLSRENATLCSQRPQNRGQNRALSLEGKNRVLAAKAVSCAHIPATTGTRAHNQGRTVR